MRSRLLPRPFCVLATVTLLAAALSGVPGVWAQSGSELDLRSLVQQAFDLHQKGQFAQALPLLRRAYTLSPNDYFVNLLLGIDSLRTGDTRAAVPYLQRAARQRPKEDYPLSYLGEAYAREQIYGQAAESHLKAVTVAPGSAEPSIAFVDFALSRFADLSASLRSTTRGLASEYRLRAMASNTQDADHLTLLQRSSDLDPSAPGIWSDLGRASFAAGDMRAATDNLHRSIQSDPEDLSAWILDALLSARNDEWKQAIARINAVANRSPEILLAETTHWPKDLLPPDGIASGVSIQFFMCVHTGKGSCPVSLNGRGAAISKNSPDFLFHEQRWERLIALPVPRPSENKAWLQRGVAYAHLEQCAHAIPALERGLSGPSPEIYAMFLLSWCYSREAGRVAEQVQQSAENEAPLRMMRGDIFLRLQAKADLALAEYQKALLVAPGDPSVLERLAEAEFGAGKTDAARQHAQSALQIDSQRLGAKRTLAKIAIQDRDYATAVPLLRELAARNPNDVTGRVELGKACAQTGALEDARDNLAPALEHGYPDEKGTLHYLLGTVLKKMGKNEEATKQFAKATELSQAFQQKSYRDQDPDAQP